MITYTFTLKDMIIFSTNTSTSIINHWKKKIYQLIFKNFFLIKQKHSHFFKNFETEIKVSEYYFSRRYLVHFVTLKIHFLLYLKPF